MSVNVFHRIIYKYATSMSGLAIGVAAILLALVIFLQRFS